MRSLALITASCPTANPQPPGEHVHPKLRTRASSYRHLSFKHAHTGGWERTHTNTVCEYTRMGMKERPHKHFKEPPCTCANSCPLHWCFHASHRCWKTPSLHQRVHVRVKGRGREVIYACVNVRRPHSAATELNREHSQLSDVSFSNCCRTGKVETCPYT